MFIQILLGHCILEKLHSWKKVYTTAGRVGRFKSNNLFIIIQHWTSWLMSDLVLGGWRWSSWRSDAALQLLVRPRHCCTTSLPQLSLPSL